MAHVNPSLQFLWSNNHKGYILALII